ncbi:uncharacterized protein FIBRA_03439 [Fibroporia radiculosa]|uniref:MI domain-containing protein n=1 Tax=Fibroporia radiculosa TaxID=599839 RepID=J4G5I5_9APHY|nr:uncharacterized protein FIBRA_03439 [Fibroporia radiculosa]CCM01388.1 predicted protein [Fibroporia radiculosa]
MPLRGGPSLPKSLLEELNNNAGTSSGDDGKKWSKTGNRQLSRKETRKQDRQSRKERKAEYFTSLHVNNPRLKNKRNTEDEHPESPKRKKVKIAHTPITTIIAPRDARSSLSQPKISKERIAPSTKVSSKARKVPPPTIEVPVASRSRQDEEEDAYIAYLESKLGWKKGGKRTTKYGKGGNDGLDDLLNDLDNMERSVFSQPEVILNTTVESNESVSDTEQVASGEEEDKGSPLDGGSSSDEEESVDAERGLGYAERLDDGSDDDKSSSSVPATSTPAAAGSRYIPPHLRKVAQVEDEGQSEEQVKLSRQLKGLLNRMSEQNIASIVDAIEELYRSHRRHDVSSTLTTLIIDGISAHSALLDSYVVLHAAFISAFHKLIGVEFAAFFVQHVVNAYERYFPQPAQQPVEDRGDAAGSGRQPNDETIGKECTNLVVLLSELYNFQVISCVLVYDIIRGLLDGELTEFKVELLLKVTRNSGYQLRQDDATALKSIIQIVQSKLSGQANVMTHVIVRFCNMISADLMHFSSRARFMVETLTNLKNNRTKRGTAHNAGDETVERLRKFLAGLGKKRHVLAHEPLRVTLADLHSAESKGKWWIVGAAWGGDPLVEHAENQREVQDKAESDSIDNNVLLKLARKQGMNTEIRRGIFVVLMSSDDYVDACERLSQLKLSDVQQREIIRVILHCCGNEKSFNPYYILVGQQLCQTSHSHKITLQFCLWDFLRDLGETNVGGAELIKNLGEDGGFGVKNISSTRMKNVARAYGWWIAKNCCTLAILKPVDFTVLKPRSQTFLKELFTHIFISTQLSTPLLNVDPENMPTTRNRSPLEEVFMKAARMQTLAIGLVYFARQAFNESDDNSGYLNWASQVARDTLRTGIDIVAGL